MNKTTLFFLLWLGFLLAAPSAWSQKSKDKCDCKVLTDSIKTLKQDLSKQKAEIEDLKKNVGNNSSSAAADLQAKDKEIAELRRQLDEARKNQTPNNSTAELDAAQKQAREYKEQLDAAKKQADIAQAQAAAAKTREEAAARELNELKKRFSESTLEAENAALRKQFLEDIDRQVGLLVQRSDFGAARQEAERLKTAINAMEQRKKLPQSTEVYLNKIKDYEQMMAALNQARTALDQPYTVEGVTTALTQLKAASGSATLKPTPDQDKQLKDLEKLLSEYCGRHNYASSKLEDADAFGKDAKGATEEIDAAISRIDKNYTFLMRRLQERKKSPTDSKINLARVACP